VAYDDLKEHEGKAYSGMRIGGQHAWDYPDGVWKERKVAPDRWDVAFASTKRRQHRAPPGSGAPPGTEFHWYLLTHQRVRKVDADTYETLMEGAKYKVAHKRPHWKRWSSEYPGRPSERERVIAILRATLAQLEEEQRRERPSLEQFGLSAGTPPSLASPPDDAEQDGEEA